MAGSRKAMVLPVPVLAWTRLQEQESQHHDLLYWSSRPCVFILTLAQSSSTGLVIEEKKLTASQ